jgi:hypothetical protein
LAIAIAVFSRGSEKHDLFYWFNWFALSNTTNKTVSAIKPIKQFFLPGTANGLTIDYGSESPILIFETKKIHIGNQTLNAGSKYPIQTQMIRCGKRTIGDGRPHGF